LSTVRSLLSLPSSSVSLLLSFIHFLPYYASVLIDVSNSTLHYFHSLLQSSVYLFFLVLFLIPIPVFSTAISSISALMFSFQFVIHPLPN
jgi:hypothetical protein